MWERYCVLYVGNITDIDGEDSFCGVLGKTPLFYSAESVYVAFENNVLIYHLMYTWSSIDHYNMVELF